MTEAEIELLKGSSGKTVELLCIDGEVLEARLLSVSESERDVVYDLISSNMPGRYVSRKGNEAYLTPFEEIDSFRLLND